MDTEHNRLEKKTTKTTDASFMTSLSCVMSRWPWFSSLEVSCAPSHLRSSSIMSTLTTRVTRDTPVNEQKKPALRSGGALRPAIKPGNQSFNSKGKERAPPPLRPPDSHRQAHHITSTPGGRSAARPGGRDYRPRALFPKSAAVTSAATVAVEAATMLHLRRSTNSFTCVRAGGRGDEG